MSGVIIRCHFPKTISMRVIPPRIGALRAHSDANPMTARIVAMVRTKDETFAGGLWIESGGAWLGRVVIAVSITVASNTTQRIPQRLQ